MSYADGMENGIRSAQARRDRAHTVCGDRLVETTPEVNRDVAESAMLLSQGARRAIEMMREAGDQTGAPATSAAAAVVDDADL